MLWSSLILGFLGSTHCAVMCGPINLAIPGQKTFSKFLISRLTYNFGRIITYMALGAAFSQLRVIFINEYQEAVSIGLGTIIILLSFTFLSQKFEKSISGIISPSLIKTKNKLKQYIHPKQLLFSLFIGVINGFLPCGLVYMALLGSISLSGTIESTQYMLIFGLGTLPMMLTISIIGLSIKPNSYTILKKITPVFTIALGITLILRGFQLDIPYVSPVLSILHPHLPSPTICQ